MIKESQQIEMINTWDGESPWSETLRLNQGRKYSVFYSPFEYINQNAKIVLVGITPGITQAREALAVAQCKLLFGASFLQAMEAAKKSASFGGRMRGNLVEMLDYVGLPAKLGIVTSAELFQAGNDLAHFTSILRYPVITNEGKMLADAREALKPDLEQWFREGFCQELNELPNAVYIPLGKGVEDVLLRLVSEERIASKQVLSGLPHPSGANAERISYFLGKKTREKLSAKTNADKLDRARSSLVRQTEKLFDL